MGSATYTAECFVRETKGSVNLKYAAALPHPHWGRKAAAFFDLNQVLLTAGWRQENTSSLQALSSPCVDKLTISQVNASPRVVSCSRTSL